MLQMFICENMQRTLKLMIFLGGGEVTKNITKDQRGGGGQQKITEDHNHKVEGRAKKVGQTESAHKGNNYSQDQWVISS